MTADRSQAPADLTSPEAPLTLYLVKRLELVVRALLDDELRPHGLTTLQYTAMSVLERREEGLSSAQLARRSFLRPQTMHEMVLTLEKRGLIERTPDPNNRRILLAQLTTDGKTLLKQCEPLVNNLEERMLEPLSPGQRHILRESLELSSTSLAEYSHTKDLDQES